MDRTDVPSSVCQFDKRNGQEKKDKAKIIDRRSEKIENGVDRTVERQDCLVDGEEIVYKGRKGLKHTSSRRKGLKHTSSIFEVTDNVNVCKMLEVMHLSPPVACSKRKLLVLDVNGLLADIVFPPPKDCRAEINILKRAIFKRPFCDDFWNFCFDRFDVGIWSSRSKKIIDPLVDYLLGDMKHKLLFCWDRSQCTKTGFNTLENRFKPVVFKELSKIWEKGTYNESNTLLVDDSPYKALMNPIHTSIFPCSYTYKDHNDDSLGRGGDLRVYLEGLAAAEDVRKYVKEHPFGQSYIDETSSMWSFYSRVMSSVRIGH